MKVYFGIDIGSVATKFAALDGDDEIIAVLYLPTDGDPVIAVQRGLKQIRQQLPEGIEVAGVATTGSARRLGGVIIGADMVKNEITCHAAAALRYVPGVRTIIEIGGQDSKIIIIRDGMVADFGMNTVCAAGTGSFLDHQAMRLNMSIEEFSRRALDSDTPAHIAGRCTVFAESDMIHKQQIGHRIEDIQYGLCQALVRNYLGDVGSRKDIQAPVVFQGGVAGNRGIVRALREELDTEIIIPIHHGAMGAIGAALLVHEEMAGNGMATGFSGFGASEVEYHTSSFECKVCPCLCEIAQISSNGIVVARWGGRCDMWDKSQNRRDIQISRRICG